MRSICPPPHPVLAPPGCVPTYPGKRYRHALDPVAQCPAGHLHGARGSGEAGSWEAWGEWRKWLQPGLREMRGIFLGTESASKMNGRDISFT